MSFKSNPAMARLMADIVVGSDKNRHEIAIAVGDSLRIGLAERQSDFRWQMEPSSLQGISALRLQSVDHQLEGREGGSGRRVFHFSAEAAGQATLRFELAPIWEGETARETFAIAVDVR